MKINIRKINQLFLLIVICVGTGAALSQLNRVEAVEFSNCPDEKGTIGTDSCPAGTTVRPDFVAFICRKSSTTDTGASACCQYDVVRWNCRGSDGEIVTDLGSKNILTSGTVGYICMSRYFIDINGPRYYSQCEPKPKIESPESPEGAS